MRSTKSPSWIDRLLGLAPAPAPPHVFAVSSEAVRYGSFHRGETGFVFDASEVMELEPETFSDGVLGGPVRELQAFRDRLADFVRQLAGPIAKASLVLPDTWLRLTFIESSELPRRAAEREEILRWKLKRLVPFRVDDLRIAAQTVTPFPSQEEPVRVLVGFAIELLLTQIEEAFGAAEVEIGSVTNSTLATYASIGHAVSDQEMVALVIEEDGAYTLTYFQAGEPLIYRYKALGELTDATLASTVRRDLRMTASFVARHFQQTSPRRVFLAASHETEEQWLSWLYDELETPPEPLAFEHFQLTRTQVGPTWLETAPLLGAASLEVR